MHPEIVRFNPGSCPICGMARELPISTVSPLSFFRDSFQLRSGAWPGIWRFTLSLLPCSTDPRADSTPRRCRCLLFRARRHSDRHHYLCRVGDLGAGAATRPCAGECRSVDPQTFVKRAGELRQQGQTVMLVAGGHSAPSRGRCSPGYADRRQPNDSPGGGEQVGS